MASLNLMNKVRTSEIAQRTIRLFGVPYQFTDAVDPRWDNISSTVGKKFMENILLEAPILTIVPGEPRYLPATKDAKQAIAYFWNESSSGFDITRKALEDKGILDVDEKFRYYDFQPAYTDYMTYVNILCRTCATFLELGEDASIDGTALQQYDWRYYTRDGNNKKDLDGIKNKVIQWTKMVPKRDPETNKVLRYTKDTGTHKKGDIIYEAVTQNTKAVSNMSNTDMIYQTTPTYSQKVSKDGTSVKTTITDKITDTVEDILSNRMYLQFYIDPESGSSAEAHSNTTGDSELLSGFLGNMSKMGKEIGFLVSSSGLDTGEKSMAKTLMEGIDNMGTGLAETIVNFMPGNNLPAIVGRLFNTGTSVIKGDNAIIPQIYQSSDTNNDFSFTVHLKAIYGSKYGIYRDIMVPLMHLLALALPRQTTANTYQTPFLVKAIVDGSYQCNLGMVTEIAINKNVNPQTWSVDGLPTEVDVTMTIHDLYSDLTMSPQTHPDMFLNNTSLIEYLSMTCGLSMISPNIEIKQDMLFSSYTNKLFDTVSNFKSRAMEEMTNWALQITGISW